MAFTWVKSVIASRPLTRPFSTHCRTTSKVYTFEIAFLQLSCIMETYKEFIGTSDISFGGNNFEIYFEEDDIDKFAENLGKCNVEYVHSIKEHSWGQRVVRFYDPDRHIIEVGENMKAVRKRFIDSGLTPEQTAQRMDVPMEYINECMQ